MRIRKRPLRWDYWHDGDGMLASIEVDDKGYKKHLYRLEVGFSDATDYERLKLYLEHVYSRAPLVD